jgi:hypothetical protein
VRICCANCVTEARRDADEMSSVDEEEKAQRAAFLASGGAAAEARRPSKRPRMELEDLTSEPEGLSQEQMTGLTLPLSDKALTEVAMP